MRDQALLIEKLVAQLLNPWLISCFFVFDYYIAISFLFIREVW